MMVKPHIRKRIIVPLFIGLIAVTIFFLAEAGAGTQEMDISVQYEQVNNTWRERLLRERNIGDPRDEDEGYAVFVPLVRFDRAPIEVSNFTEQGEGWQITGSHIDTLVIGDSTYALYGRENRFYIRPALSWNNTVDKKRSFEDFLVVRDTGEDREIIAAERIEKTASQTLLGLRLSEDARRIEVAKGGVNGHQPTVLWSQAARK